MKFKNHILLSLLLLLTILSSCTNNLINENIDNIEKDIEVNNQIEIENDIEENNETSNEGTNNLESEENTEETEIEDEPELEETDPTEDVDLSLKPNELGQIMILMYHSIGDVENEWSRTPDNFRNDLEYLYQNGYRAISLKDFAEGNITTKEGYTPFIITFDDGNNDNFNIIEKDGENIVDKNSAVGIMDEFKEKYPDFNLTATFFLFGTNSFRQPELVDYKLNYLIENGYDIGNHTYNHQSFKKLNPEEIQYQLGKLSQYIADKVENYEVNTLALTFGSKPKKEYYNYLVEGEYDNTPYKNIAILDVGWKPSYSPYDERIDFTLLPRIRASETKVDNVGMYNWIKYFEKYPERKFISDGKPEVITIPKEKEENLNEILKEDKIIYIYEEKLEN